MNLERQDLDARLHRVATYLAASRQPTTDQITATLAAFTVPDTSCDLDLFALHAEYVDRCARANTEPLKLGTFANTLAYRGYELLERGGFVLVAGLRPRQ